jgi:hypothetical protein
MAFTGNYFCTSAKVDFLSGAQTPLTDTIKIALYTQNATFDASTTVYSATDEVSDSGTYVAGGGTLLGSAISYSGTTAWLTFNDIVFSGATIVARGALIYNATKSNKSIAVLDFGSNKSTSGGAFTIQFPIAGETTSIIRIA